MPKRKNTIDDFYSRITVNPETDCWEMGGFKNADGYVQFRLFDRDWIAHRLSAYLDGRDPTGKVVCHHCDNPCCVNPQHLFLGTAKDNAVDRTLKGRSRGNSLRGAARPSNAKLAPELIREIEASTGSARSVALRLGVSRDVVSKYRRIFQQGGAIDKRKRKSVHPEVQGQSID